MNREITIKRVEHEGEDFLGLTADRDIAREKKIEAWFDSNKGMYVVDLPDSLWEELRQKLGSKYNLDLDHDVTSGEAHEFWGSKMMQVRLEPNTMVLNLDENPINIAKLGVMRGHPWIANSLKEYNQGRWSEAKYIIIDDFQDVREKADKAMKRAKAHNLIIELDNTAKVDILQVYHNKLYTNASPEKIISDFGDLAESDPSALMELHSLGEEILEVRSLVVQGISTGILQQNGPNVEFNGESLGIGVEEAADFLLKDSKLKLHIMDKVKTW
jgi:hypothetical protein